ncbi:MAG: fructose 1,6-bisphosphatase [Thermotogae bacterium]|nr:MAG: fructose 1,6-bisphosphatase [Thermotogota bacterium]
MELTLSVIKADIGGYIGHSRSHPKILELAKKLLNKHKGKELIDFCVTACGDDLELIMTHKLGNNSEKIHGIAWDVFKKCTSLAKELKLYGAGQDLLKDAFSGNLKGMGPGVAEISFEERKSEPVIVFMADKTEPGAWNLPLFRIFADPFNTAGLVIDPKMHQGFRFEVHDVVEHKKIYFDMPEEMYDILALIAEPAIYVIKHVFRKKDNMPAAVTSTQRLSLMAGRYVGKDDPVCIVRCQSGLPAVGEVLEPFAFPHLVAGWMRGSHNGPLMPVSVEQATPSRFDGPPRVMALGFQLSNGKLLGPVDMFADISFEYARKRANEIADYMRRHGPFMPHRLAADEMEYTTLPDVLRKFARRFEKLD